MDESLNDWQRVQVQMINFDLSDDDEPEDQWQVNKTAVAASGKTAAQAGPSSVAALVAMAAARAASPLEPAAAAENAPALPQGVEAVNALSRLKGLFENQHAEFHSAKQNYESKLNALSELTEIARICEEDNQRLRAAESEYKVQIEILRSECAEKDALLVEAAKNRAELIEAKKASLSTRQQIADLETELASLQELCSSQTQQMKTQADDFHLQLSTLMKAEYDTELEIKSLRRREEQAYQQLTSLREQLDESRAAVAAAQKALADAMAAHERRESELRAECAEMDRSNRAAMIEMDRSNRAAMAEAERSHRAQTEALEKENSKLRAELSKAAEEIHLKTNLIVTNAAEIARLQAAAQKHSSELSQARVKADDLARDLGGAQATEVELRKQVASLRATESRLEGELEEALESEGRLKEENLSLQGDLATQQRLRGAFEIEVAKLQQSCRDKDNDLSKLAAELESLFESAQKQSHEQDLEIARLRGVETKYTVERAALRKHEGDVSLREKRMKSALETLLQAKGEILRCSAELSREVQAAQALNPLKDYLPLTEFEISKLENQLKRTPPGAPGRRELERALAQMVEQREFLRTALEGSQKQLERQAATLSRINQTQWMSDLGTI